MRRPWLDYEIEHQARTIIHKKALKKAIRRIEIEKRGKKK